MKFLYLLLIITFIVSCKSPAELLEKGDYDAAFNKALAEIKKNKNVDQNTEIIRISAKKKTDKALKYSELVNRSNEIEDWVAVQTELYKVLEDVGQANVMLDGMISDSYDELCGEKKDVDYQIVEHYFDEGHAYLDDFYYNGQKEDARSAYYSFISCEKYEGDKFFPSLLDDTADAYENGVVFYKSNYGNIGSALFLKRLPFRSDVEPDCDIRVDHGFVSYSESESDSRDVHTKKIQVGQEEIKDTSGYVTYEPIYESISATVVTKTITVTANMTTTIRSENVTGQCTVKTYSYSTSISDSYKEVSVKGDEKALRYVVQENSGAPINFENELKDDLIDKAEENIQL